jgi:dienelactone hydrolase
MRAKRRVRLILRVMTAIVVALVVICVGYVAIVSQLSRRVIAVPDLTGPSDVGRTMAEWVDRTRVDPLAPGGGPRRLSVWLWYPSAAAGTPAGYAPGGWRKLLFGGPVGWFESDADRIRVHATADAPVAGGKLPIVVLEPGMGLSAPQYTAVAENLASHGYLVAGVTPTYSANLTMLDGVAVTSTAKGNPPDLGGHSGNAQDEGNALVALWAADARFVAREAAALDGPFRGKVEQGAVTYVGHSFGGAASLEACHLDRHCVGAVDLDGTQFGSVVQEGLSVPSMILGSEDSCVTGTCGPDATNPEGERETASSFVKASTGMSWRFILNGARHFNFTDYSLYFLAPPVRNLVPLGSIDGRRALSIENACLTAFLDLANKRGPAGALDKVLQDNPELSRT